MFMSVPTTPGEITGDDLEVDYGRRKFYTSCGQAVRMAANVCNMSIVL